MSAGPSVPWAGSQHGPVPSVPCPWSCSSRAPEQGRAALTDVTTWKPLCEPTPLLILGTLRRKAISNYGSAWQGCVTGLRGDLRWGLDVASQLQMVLLWSVWAWTRQLQLGQEPGVFSGGIKGNKDEPSQAIRFDLTTTGRLRTFLVDPAPFCSIFSYLTITWLHLLYFGKVYNNLDIFSAKSWKKKGSSQGKYLPVGHGKFSWHWQGLPVTLAPGQELWHTGFNGNVQKMPGKETGEVGWQQLHFRKNLPLTQDRSTMNEKQESIVFLQVQALFLNKKLMLVSTKRGETVRAREVGRNEKCGILFLLSDLLKSRSWNLNTRGEPGGEITESIVVPCSSPLLKRQHRRLS